MRIEYVGEDWRPGTKEGITLTLASQINARGMKRLNRGKY